MRRVVLLGVIGALFAAPALAGLELKETSVDPGLSLQIESTGWDGWTGAGVYNLNIIDSGIPGLDGAQQAFCIDVWDVNPTSYAEYDPVALGDAPDPGAGPMGAVKARQLAQLLDAWWNSDLDTDIEGAALQSAVWEVVDEGSEDADDYDVTVGDFRVLAGNSNINAARTLANTMLKSINTGIDFSGYLALTNHETDETAALGKYQDYVVKVPVPAAFILGLLGMSVAGIRLRKHA